MADIFDKCVQFKTGMECYGKQFFHDMNIDWYKDYDLFQHWGYNVLYGDSPIDNGGPVISDGDKQWLQFSTNDYLGMSRHPELRQVAADYVKRYGVGTPMGSRLLTGSTPVHSELDRRVAQFKKTETALTFATGANAMIGAISALTLKEELTILDQFAHASLYCGAKISGTQIKTFRHNDLNDLERILKSADPSVAKLIVVDGVYSMTGTIAPLQEICDLKDRYHARLLVDDAHGNGVYGQSGRGVAEVLGVEDRIDIHAGTFSKAFGSKGGFIASHKEVIDYLRYTSYTNLFTKSQPAVLAAVTLKSIDIVEKSPDLRDKVHENARYLQNRLRTSGYDIGITTTAITPITFPDLAGFIYANELRFNYGIWASPVSYPAIPLGKSIMRIIPTAHHTKDHLDHLCDSLDAISARIAQAKNKPGKLAVNN